MLLTETSAADEGVGALTSATMSHIVKSVSCPTPETIGILQLKISLARPSELNGQRSSIDPPPLAITIISISLLLPSSFTASIKSADAPSP